MSGLDREATLPEIDKGAAVPVKVIPVLDLSGEVLKLGQPNPAKIPSRWRRRAPDPERAFVSTTADKNVEAIPHPERRVAEAGVQPPAPDAAVPDAAPEPPEPEASTDAA